SGAISGNGSLVKTGAGALTLTGSNTYSGETNVSAGTLVAGTANAFSANSTITVADVASLDFGGFNQTIGGLSGGGPTSLGAGVVTIDQSADTTYSGTISGSGSLVKNGSGKLLLTGDGSGFIGTTTVGGGILSVNGALGGIINVMSGGTLG